MRDEVLSKEQFKELLGHTGLGIKSAALLMYSSGMRIGEVMKLKIDDLYLDEDPPYADVRAKYTKRGSGGRQAYFSYEARDSIEDWLKEKYAGKIADGEDLLFGYSGKSWRYHWNKACEKANVRLSAHPLKVRVTSFALRKCFRVNMGMAGMPDRVVYALMGHKDPEDDTHGGIHRLPLEHIARVYKEHMSAVSIYEAEADEREMLYTVEKGDESGAFETQLETKDLDEALAEAIRLYDIWVEENPGKAPMLCRIGIYVSLICEECGFPCFATESCLRCGHPVEIEIRGGYSILNIVEE